VRHLDASSGGRPLDFRAPIPDPVVEENDDDDDDDDEEEGVVKLGPNSPQWIHPVVFSLYVYVSVCASAHVDQLFALLCSRNL
jgi:hypothetical protein